MTRLFNPEEWRGHRNELVKLCIGPLEYVAQVNRELEKNRRWLHEELALPEPEKFATTSLENTVMLLGEITELQSRLILRARNVHNYAIDEDEDDEPPKQGLV